MTNTTHFIEFLEKMTLMKELYFELVHLWWLRPVVFIFVLVGFVYLAFVTLISPFLLQQSRTPKEDIFFAAFQGMIRKKFHHQTDETFKTIEIGTNRVLRPNTEDPTVLMMLAPQGAWTTACRLVALLIHCILLANHLPSSEHDVLGVISYGGNYTSADQEWTLFHQVRRQLKFYGVAAVLSFECLHPQVVRALQLLVPQVHAASPQSVLILVVDMKNQLTEYKKNNLTPNNIGKTVLQEYFGPYFHQIELLEIIKRFGCRCVLVNPEPGQ